MVVVIICGSKLLFLLLIMVVDFTLSLSGEGEADDGGGVDGSVWKNVYEGEKEVIIGGLLIKKRRRWIKEGVKSW